MKKIGHQLNTRRRGLATGLGVLYGLGILVTLVHLSAGHACVCVCHAESAAALTGETTVGPGHIQACDHGLRLGDHCDLALSDLKAPGKLDSTPALVPVTWTQPVTVHDSYAYSGVAIGLVAMPIHSASSRAPPALLSA